MLYQFYVSISWLALTVAFAKNSVRLPLRRLQLSAGVDSLNGIEVTKLSSNSKIDLGKELRAKKGTSLIVLSTYAADFNALEYAQRVRHYQRRLKEKGVSNIVMVVNAEPAAVTALAQLVGLPDDVELLSDPLGTAGEFDAHVYPRTATGPVTLGRFLPLRVTLYVLHQNSTLIRTQRSSLITHRHRHDSSFITHESSPSSSSITHDSSPSSSSITHDSSPSSSFITHDSSPSSSSITHDSSSPPLIVFIMTPHHSPPTHPPTHPPTTCRQELRLRARVRSRQRGTQSLLEALRDAVGARGMGHAPQCHRRVHRKPLLAPGQI